MNDLMKRFSPEAVVNIALGIPPEKAKRIYIKHGMISFFNLPVGRKIKKINDFNYLHTNPNVIWAYLFFKEGDVIPDVLHMGHRSGFVIVTGDNRDNIFDLSDFIKKKIIECIELE